MITITFDDAVNNNNIELYDEIFDAKRKNPNGCQIKATFFLSHKYANYSAVQVSSNNINFSTISQTNLTSGISGCNAN